MSATKEQKSFQSFLTSPFSYVKNALTSPAARALLIVTAVVGMVDMATASCSTCSDFTEARDNIVELCKQLVAQCLYSSISSSYEFGQQFSAMNFACFQHEMRRAPQAEFLRQFATDTGNDNIAGIIGKALVGGIYFGANPDAAAHEQQWQCSANGMS